VPGGAALAGAKIGTWLLRRRLEKRFKNARPATPPPTMPTSPTPPATMPAAVPPDVAIDPPTPRPAVLRHNEYVTVEGDLYARATQWASAQIVKKYPGAEETMLAHQSLVEQYIAAHNAAA
jgi:hypothetical protein